MLQLSLLVLILCWSCHETAFAAASIYPVAAFQDTSHVRSSSTTLGRQRCGCWIRGLDNRWQIHPSCTLRYTNQRRHAISIQKALEDHVADEKEAISPETKTSQGSRQTSSTLPPPIYITIGPPCCGKTEALRSYLLSEGHDPDIVFAKDAALDCENVSPDVYHRIPLATYLFPTMAATTTNSMSASQSIGDHLLKSGSTVSERLVDPRYHNTDQELRSIILRLAGRITPQDFASRIRRQAKYDYGDTVKYFQQRRIATGEALILAVESVAVQAVSEVICQMQLTSQQQLQQDDRISTTKGGIEDGADGNDDEDGEELPYSYNGEKSDPSSGDNVTSLLSTLNATQQAQLLSAKELIGTRHVDLYIPHAIFNGGLDRAKNTLFDELRLGQELQKKQRRNMLDDDAGVAHAENAALQPAFWGNTNTRPMEYVVALEAAQEFHRPVKFVAWGTSRLPRVSRQELLRRNVARFRKSGRCIPSGAISAALGRVETLITEAQKVVETRSALSSTSSDDDNEGIEDELDDSDEAFNHRMDVALANLAGYRMDRHGFVEKVGEPKNWERSKKKKAQDIKYHEPPPSKMSN